MSKKFALHPGEIRSMNDGQYHYISASRLAQLYELRPDEYIVWSEAFDCRYWNDYQHLYPDYYGRYGRPLPPYLDDKKDEDEAI